MSARGKKATKGNKKLLSTSNSNIGTTNNTKELQPVVVEQPEVVLPTEKQEPVPQSPFNFSVPRKHMDVLNKKTRALKKKLRKINEQEAKLSAGKKLEPEQQRVLAEKPHIERALKDLDEIRDSLVNIDFTMELSLLLGVFSLAAKSQEGQIIELAATLLPPNTPPPGFNPLQELQHAVEIANKFLQNSDEELFSQPKTTYADLQSQVVGFLTSPENNYAVSIPPADSVPEAQPTTAQESTPEALSVERELPLEVSTTENEPELVETNLENTIIIQDDPVLENTNPEQHVESKNENPDATQQPTEQSVENPSLDSNVDPTENPTNQPAESQTTEENKEQQRPKSNYRKNNNYRGNNYKRSRGNRNYEDRPERTERTERPDRSDNNNRSVNSTNGKRGDYQRKPRGGPPRGKPFQRNSTDNKERTNPPPPTSN